MSTATKLEYLGETKSQLKDTINLTGANLTNDTFRSYPSKLYKKLLDSINDNEELYENLPKVNGTGTDITLNNTDECKIKFNMLGGNTIQDGTPTPSSPVDVENVVGVENYFNPTIEWIKNNVICQIENQEITFNGTSNTGATNPTAISNIPTGDYIITLEVLEGTHTNNKKIWIDFFNGTTKITNMSFTSSETSKTITFNSMIDNIKVGYESGDTFTNYRFRIMIEKGSVAHEYVPYGLWASVRTQNEDNTKYQTKYIDLNIYDNSGNVIGHNELCKIGDYRDYFKKNSGKNLLKNVATTTTTGGVTFTIKDNGIVLTNNTASGNLYFTLNEMMLSAGTYTISGCASGGSNQKYKFLVFDVTAGANVNSDYGSGMTFTAEEGHIYRFQIVVYSGCNTTGLIFKPQLEKGNQATPFELYGKGWYLHKEIGKVVLDGSENWQDRPNFNDCDRFVFNTSIIPSQPINCLSNYFLVNNSVISTIGYLITSQGDQVIINFSAKGTTTLAQFKTWLSTHNTEVYYVLATPTDTIITNQSVIDSLESIVKSYEDETHIVSVDDVPMYLDVSAVSKYNLQN